jgi:hypothetical protein
MWDNLPLYRSLSRESQYAMFLTDNNWLRFIRNFQKAAHLQALPGRTKNDIE